MPKIVDPDRRRAAIADALFDVLREGGLSKVTLANVAERSGLAVGSVRHFLGTREEMVGFAFGTISDRIHDRILARSQTLLADLDRGKLDGQAKLEATADLLCELLPLDAARREESVVWIEFETAARTDPQLAETSQRATKQVTRLIETMLESAQGRGGISPTIDAGLESARLAALIDGLALRCTLHPDLLSAEVARSVVIAHLQEIHRSAGGDGQD